MNFFLSNEIIHAAVSEKLMVGSLLHSKVTRRGHLSASNRDLVLCTKRGYTLIGDVVRCDYPGLDGMSFLGSGLLIVNIGIYVYSCEINKTYILYSMELSGR